jgi:type VI protein secretion system component VasK
VLSDSRKAVSSDLSPEALKARLTQRYFTDFAGSWLSFLNSLQLNPANNIADVTDQLTLMSDVRQSPLIALMNTSPGRDRPASKAKAFRTPSSNRLKTWSAEKTNR